MKLRGDILKISKSESASVLGCVDRRIPLEDALFAGFALSIEAQRALRESREHFEDPTSTYGPTLVEAAAKMRTLGAKIMEAYDPELALLDQEVASFSQ